MWERGGALDESGLAACDGAHLKEMEPHHRRCLKAQRASPRETGLFPVHAHWCPRGSRKGALRDSRATRDVSCRTRGPVENRTRLHGRRARMPGRPSPASAAASEEDEAARRSRRPSRPGPKRGARAAAGLRPLPGPFLHEHCQTPTNPAARRGHQIPCCFGHCSPFGHFIPPCFGFSVK